MPATSHTCAVGGKPYSTARWRGGPSAPRSGQPSQSAGGLSPETSTSPDGMSRCWLVVMGPLLHGLGHRLTFRSSLIPIRGLLKGIKHRLLCLRVGGQGVNQHRFYLLPLNVYLPVYGSGTIKLP